MQRMCGRFVQAEPVDYYADFLGAATVKTESLDKSWNVAPTDSVYAAAEFQGERQLGAFKWGLLPFWAKDRKMAARNINARAETVAEKPAFRDSFARKRCIIPADGFYEWEPKERGKLPHYIHAADGKPLAFAGLWSSWRDPETSERIKTCTIITGRPNSVVSPIHDRMPVALLPDTWDTWLDPDNHDVEVLVDLLKPIPARLITEYPVSTLVNKVQNNVPECIAPLDSGAVDAH